MSGRVHDGGASDDRVDVLVVGAGPAGLALARQLRRRGVAFRVVDASGPCASWRAMPPALRLVSPWWTNALRWRDAFRHPPFAMVGADDFAAYLDAFRTRERIAVDMPRRVESVAKAADVDGYVVTTSTGPLQARAVVFCTGYFSTPVGAVPAPASDASVPVLHAAAYPGPAEVRRIAGDRPVVVVGRRVSAGQIMVELADAGVPVVLSTRAPVEFRRDGLWGELRDAIYYFYEELLLRVLRPRLHAPSFPVMDGGRARELVGAGTIAVRPAIARIDRGCVEFVDGSTLEAGLVINATGYRPSLPDLAAIPFATDSDGLPQADEWEIVGAPGLFVLGLDNRRNYRSRTLRGIRSDCVHLAKTIATRLGDRRSGR
jgi:glycine/D-amino acid oxidase-like deaminating enzyme